LDSQAPVHGTIQKENLTSRAHPAKPELSKTWNNRVFRAAVHSQENLTPQPRIVFKGLDWLNALAWRHSPIRLNLKVDWYIVTHSDDDKIRNSLAGSTVLVFESLSAACLFSKFLS
jgi:hypothetical protein